MSSPSSGFLKDNMTPAINTKKKKDNKDRRNDSFRTDNTSLPLTSDLKDTQSDRHNSELHVLSDKIWTSAEGISSLLDNSRNLKNEIKIGIEGFLNELKDVSRRLLRVEPTSIHADSNVSQLLAQIIQVQEGISKDVQSMKTKSWASVTANNVSPGLQSKPQHTQRPTSESSPRRTFSAVVKAVDTTLSTNKVSELFKRTIDPKKLKCGINRCSNLSNNTIRLEFDTESERDRVTDEVNKTGVMTSMKSKEKRPLFILKGVPNDVNKEDLLDVRASKENDFIDSLVHQNQQLANIIDKSPNEKHITILFRRKNRNDNLVNIVLEVSPDVYRSLKDVNRLYVGHNRIHLSEFSSFLQCYKCFGFGHTSKHCSQTEDTCGHCAGKHRTTECDHKVESSTRCVNCHKSNVKFQRQESTSHVATSRNCPHVEKMRQRVKEMTNYGL
jgi:hypothetical protein